MTDFLKLAEMLYPKIDKTPAYYEAKHPLRSLPDGAIVTRFAPSPTGFLHIGAIFAAMVSKKAALQSKGVFFLRIEDTDKKREIEDGLSEITKGLAAFGIIADEGFSADGTEFGEYGPYQQSCRVDIYQCFAKELVKKGLAYPCFCDEDKLNEVRQVQEAAKLRTGYYGAYTECRDLPLDEILANLAALKPFILRLRSPGKEDKRISFVDAIKGKIEMPENDQDLVLLKRDGIPTYHFAHVIDDHLMRTTHVIRGDEWISSTPIHLQLFWLLEFKPPKYAHISPIMKEENGGKRKLSKRKDPEAAVLFYEAEGFPKQSVTEYLTTISNSNFEDWRKANKLEPIENFPFLLNKMSLSGALFDMNKLTDVSKNVISLMTADEVYNAVCLWSNVYDESFYQLFSRAENYSKAILAIDRINKNPRKDISKWSEIKEYYSYFFDSLYSPTYQLPENFDKNYAIKILVLYKNAFDIKDDKDEWFSKIKSICEPLGFSPDVKAYKQNPEQFNGHVGEVSTIIRIAITDRQNTPDLWSIMQLISKDTILKRLENAIENWGK